ncbi:proline iminopeptidase-family hydrolase [Sphaerochaeta sp.]|uniref:proline iminopeptidase-family hydrolase n=1 Tax=Sphaerochaeta sp. TaxID=1972642 RepID=UPI002585507D|nr:proline iminopeptidase-family hydrolase [Sphaerochaeta sp.]MDD3456795.1 proline iminopeptidase-family hydrolase [Sphaerochaeta sp.]
MQTEVRMIPITTAYGEYKVWTQRCGSNPTKRLLLLHGGPGMTHEYFQSFDTHFADSDIEYIYYDQLGSHNSDNPADRKFWTIARFVDEVDQVRKALGLDASNFFLLGHSWGGVLAMEYALAHPEALKGLIISNMMADCTAYQKYADDVLGPQMDPKVLARIKELEVAGQYSSEEYEALLMPHHYEMHVLRRPMDQWPECVMNALTHANQDLYVYMQGPSEFGIAGVLATWDRSKDLKHIKTPALVIGAEYDTMDPTYMRWMSEQLPNGSFLYCPEGSHMAMWDDAEVYHEGIKEFIGRV